MPDSPFHLDPNGLGFWFTDGKPKEETKPLPFSVDWASGGKDFMNRFGRIQMPPGFHESNITMVEDPETGNLLISNGVETYVLEFPKEKSDE